MIAHFVAATVLVAVPTEEERLRGAFFGSLVADALCLGSHYEYDAANIKRAYGGKSIETCARPRQTSHGAAHGVVRPTLGPIGLTTRGRRASEFTAGLTPPPCD